MAVKRPAANANTRKPSAAGPSAAGPSAAGPSAAGPSEHRPLLRDQHCLRNLFHDFILTIHKLLFAAHRLPDQLNIDLIQMMLVIHTGGVLLAPGQ